MFLIIIKHPCSFKGFIEIMNSLIITFHLANFKFTIFNILYHYIRIIF